MGILTVGITGSISNEEAGESKAGTGSTKQELRKGYDIRQAGNHRSFFAPYLPRSRSFRGPYLSMTIPMGRVMADSRNDPTVKARFNISSWSLQMVQPFISRYSSESSELGADVFEKLRLELFSAR